MDNQSPGEMYAIAIIFSIVPAVAVALRFHVRIKYKQGFGLDDWLMIPALISALGTTAAMIYAVAQGGLGTHTIIEPDGAPDYTVHTEDYLKASFVTLLTQVVTFGCTKLAMLFFYKRLFRGQTFMILLWTLVGVVVAWSIAFFFGALFECTPIAANWVGNGLNSVCIQEFAFYQAGSWTDVILDVLILVLPIPMIWQLHLSTKRKLAICGIFMMGALTVLASIARLVSQYTIQAGLSTEAGADITWLIAPTFYWPVIEAALGLLGACLPTMKPLFSESSSLKSLIGSWRSLRDTSMPSAHSTGPLAQRGAHSQRSERYRTEHKTERRESDSRQQSEDSFPLQTLPRMPSPKDGILMVREFDVV